MHFAGKPGQTKVLFNKQGKNTMEQITFLQGKFLLKLKTHVSNADKKGERMHVCKTVIS